MLYLDPDMPVLRGNFNYALHGSISRVADFLSVAFKLFFLKNTQNASYDVQMLI